MGLLPAPVRMTGGLLVVGTARPLVCHRSVAFLVSFRGHSMLVVQKHEALWPRGLKGVPGTEGPGPCSRAG